MVAQISTTVIQTGIPKDDKPYILNIAAINELNDVLVDAAAACSTNASPAILAWSIILQTIREYALVSKETREIRQSLRAADKYSAGEISDTDATERLSMSGNASHQRRSSTSSDTSQQTFLEEILEKVMDTALDEDPIGYLAKNAVDGSHVFNVTAALAIEYCSTFGSNHKGKPGLKIRRMLLDLIRAALDWIEYQPILLMAALAILTGDERYWDGSEREQGFKESDPSTFFLADNILMQKLFQTALARFPYESLPFLRLCRVLAASNSGEDEAPLALWSLIETIDSLTCVLPTGFSAYELIREDEDANYVQLTGNLKFFDGVKPASNLLGGMKPFFPASATTVSPMDSLELPSGTMGRVLSESKPLVVMWRYDYSALNYMGKILQYASTDWTSFSTISATMASREVVSEIIELLTIIISSTGQKLADRKRSSTSYEFAQTILENASDGLDRNQDVVSVVLDIFEKELHHRRNVSQEEDSLDILIRCIQFIHALLPVMPDRIWPFLGRSSLLGINGVESQLSFIITSTEMISGHYGFLLGCIRVYDALIDDAIAHAILLNFPTTAVKRFGAADNAGLRVSQVTMEKVIISFQRILIDVFESLSTWKSISHEEKLEMNTWMCSIFLKILNYSFNIDDRESIQQKLTKSFAPAAQYTLDVFLSTSDSNFTVRPLLQLLLEGLATPCSSLLIRVSQLWISQTIVAIKMVTALIRINSLLGHLSSNLENQIFMATPVLAKLYATYETYRLPIVDLFDALIWGADSADKQPPSLLGHLGQDTASCFLEILSKIDQPLSDNNLSISLWGLLSTIVSKRQQWFAIFALTGNTPRNSLKDDKNHESITHQRAEPLLNIALNELSNIERLSPINAIAMLEFAMLAANYWPWVLSTMEEHEDFLSAITKFIEFSEPDRYSTEEKLKELSNDFLRLQMSSYVIDILAMITHNSKQSGKGAYGKKLLPCLPLLNKLSVSIPGYNASLHGNLRHNFESRFSGCTLAEFKRTKIKRSQLGPSFYYDLDMASSMLCIDPSWTGRHGQGFLEEMMRANTNLSLVESQVVNKRRFPVIESDADSLFRIFFIAGNFWPWS